MLAADVSNWLRPGTATSPEGLFWHVYGRGKGQAQMIPGWPYSVVAALEPGRTSWTAVLDVVRLPAALRPGDMAARAVAPGRDERPSPQACPLAAPSKVASVSCRRACYVRWPGCI